VVKVNKLEPGPVQVKRQDHALEHRCKSSIVFYIPVNLKVIIIYKILSGLVKSKLIKLCQIKNKFIKIINPDNTKYNLQKFMGHGVCGVNGVCALKLVIMGHKSETGHVI
jgi:hypothetical protein